jgi:hypothetical protein
MAAEGFDRPSKAFVLQGFGEGFMTHTGLNPDHSIGGVDLENPFQSRQ